MFIIINYLYSYKKYNQTLMLKKKYFTPYQKLATMGKFSSWWYSSHKIIFQKILIECINEIKYRNNNTKKI